MNPSGGGAAGNLNGLSSEQLHQYLSNFGEIVGYIFSWIVLLPIAIIVSGKLLATVTPISRVNTGILRIPLYILNVEARNDEVVLGFTSFIVTLIITVFAGGKAFYLISIERLGFDPGQFHALCFISACFTVVWSATIWLLTQIRAKPHLDPNDVARVLEEIKKS